MSNQWPGRFFFFFFFPFFSIKDEDLGEPFENTHCRNGIPLGITKKKKSTENKSRRSKGRVRQKKKGGQEGVRAGARQRDRERGRGFHSWFSSALPGIDRALGYADD